jgi:branched-chain amino acid transport system ATP-binding protein
MTPPPPLLEVRDVHVRLGAVRALDGVSLEVHAGERVGLIGPNGAGKSTLLDVLIGRRAPDAGTVLLDGQDITADVPRERARRGVGIVLQGGRVIDHLSVTEHLRLAALSHREARDAMVDDDLDDTIAAAMAGAGIARDQLAAALSHPQRQLLDLLMVLRSRPRLLMLDEPTSGMDREGRDRTASILRDVQAGRPMLATLIVEHDEEFLAANTDRVIRVRDGRVIAEAQEVEDVR